MIFRNLKYYHNHINCVNFEPSLLESFLRCPIDYNALKYNFIPYFGTILNRSYTSLLHMQLIEDTLINHFKNVQFDKDLQSCIPYILMIDPDEIVKEKTNALKMKSSSVLDKRKALVVEFIDYIINRYDYNKINNRQGFGMMPISKEEFKDEIFFHLNDMIQYDDFYNRSLRDLNFDTNITKLLNNLYHEFYKEHIHLLDNLRKEFLINVYKSITKFIISIYQKYFKYKIREVRVLSKNYYFKDSIYNNYENYSIYNNHCIKMVYVLYTSKCSWKVLPQELSEVFTLTNPTENFFNCQYNNLIKDIMLIELTLEDNSSVLLLKDIHISQIDNFDTKYLCSIIVNKNDYIDSYNITYNGNINDFIDELRFYNHPDLIKILYTASIKENQNIEITL